VRSRTARIVVVATFAATSLAACSDDAGTSKEDFVAAADDVCREADEKIAEIGQPRVEEGILEYVEQAQEVSADLAADLRELEPPAEDAADVEQMIDDLERATDLLEPLAQATVDRDANAVQELQEEVQQTTDDISAFADSYGFEVCGAKVLDPIR
jgi:polyhydroxyalkanoate synthesis regulator phasin